MSDANDKVQEDRRLLIEAGEKGPLATLGAYVKLSGPGWLQSAITLGGGSLSSSLYLGVLAGFSLLWLQPLAMVLGIVMLSAIGYVTLSTGERPFRAIPRPRQPRARLGLGARVAPREHGVESAAILARDRRPPAEPLSRGARGRRRQGDHRGRDPRP